MRPKRNDKLHLLLITIGSFISPFTTLSTTQREPHIAHTSQKNSDDATNQTNRSEQTKQPDQVESHHPNYFFKDTKPKLLKEPIYRSTLSHISIQLDWGKLIRQAFGSTRKIYRGSLGIYFYNCFQLSLDSGYERNRPAHTIPGINSSPSTGYYISPALHYLIVHTPLNSIYLGLAYGISRYSLDLKKTHKRHGYTSHIVEARLGSEVLTFPKVGLYFGNLLRITHPIYQPEHKEHFYTPGYGQLQNAFQVHLSLYVKWKVSL